MDHLDDKDGMEDEFPTLEETLPLVLADPLKPGAYLPAVYQCLISCRAHGKLYLKPGLPTAGTVRLATAQARAYARYIEEDQFQMSALPDPVLPRHRNVYLKVVEVPGGFQPFALLEGADGACEDLLPIREIPAMPTFRDAEELAIVITWQYLDTFRSAQGEPSVTVFD